MPPPEPIRDLLARQAARFGEAPAIRLPDRELSYEEVWSASCCVGRFLCDEYAVGPGDVVACLAGNRSATVATWFGSVAAGAVFMPVNPLLRGEPLRRILEHARPKVVIVEDELRPALGSIVADRDETWATEDVETIDRVVRSGGCEPWPDPDPDATSPAKLMYTSGTTGTPKGVVWSRGCEAEHARAYAAEMVPVAEGENVFCCLPLTHVTCQGTILATLVRGGCITVDATFDAFGFWNRMRELDVVQFTYVGTVLSVLGRRRARPDDGDNPVRRVLGAAAPGDLWLPIEERFGIEIVDVWGQTETASCWTAPESLPQTPGTIGRPVDRWDARIVAVDDDHGSGADITDPGVVGELWMRPTRPDVMFSGYLGPDGVVDRTCFDADGWYRTGDLMAWTEGGDLTFRGRIREAIRRRGEMISAGDVEAAALDIPGVSEAAAVGVQADDGVEEEIKLCVVCDVGADLDPEEIHAALREALPRFMVPRYVDMRTELPKTPSTRVRKFALSDAGVDGVWDARNR